jgi:molecular chaperone DnaK
VAYDTQRLLGLPYDDKLRPLFPFRLAELEEGKPEAGFAVEVSGGPRLSAVEASARVVEALVLAAEQKLHAPPGLLVMTVPAYFSEAQRRAAARAAEEGAGLGPEGVEVVEDAVAALVAAKYSGAMGKHRGEADDDHFDRPWVVVDVGGLLTQVSVVSLCAERGLAVRRHEVVEGLGGEQLDAALVRQLVTDFKAKHGVDLGMDYLALERLYDAAESAKLELSSKLSAAISLPFITADHTGPKHLDARFTRAQYQALCDPLVSRLKEPYDRVLQQSNLLAQDLQGVLLTGGTSRLPFVRDLVARLAGRPPLVLENPEEAAALGGAYFGREIM